MCAPFQIVLIGFFIVCVCTHKCMFTCMCESMNVCVHACASLCNVCSIHASMGVCVSVHSCVLHVCVFARSLCAACMSPCVCGYILHILLNVSYTSMERHLLVCIHRCMCMCACVCVCKCTCMQG